jgi:hypothetical protein
LRAEHGLRVSENRVLRRIFGPEGDEGTVKWRKLHNEELNNLYSSPNIVWVIKLRMIWMGRACCKHWAEEWCIQGFGGET